MRIIIYIYIGLCFMTNSAYAETLTLKGNFYPGIKDVPASFVVDKDNTYYNIVLKGNDKKALDIINKLVNMCDSTKGSECEIVAEVEKLSSDYAADGNITDIQYINGLKITEINNEVNQSFGNKYNECLKSSKELLGISEESMNLMDKAESILNENDMSKLRNDFSITFSIAENNPAEQISKNRNISICDAYIELKKEFIEHTESYINQKIEEKRKSERNNSIDCNKFIFAMESRRDRNGSYDKSYFFPENMDLLKVIINDKFDVPILNRNNSGDIVYKSTINKTPYFFISENTNLFTIYNLYKDYHKISIIGSDGTMCTLEYKELY